MNTCASVAFGPYKKASHPSLQQEGSRVHTQALDKRLTDVIRLIFSQSILITQKVAVVTQVCQLSLD